MGPRKTSWKSFCLGSSGTINLHPRLKLGSSLILPAASRVASILFSASLIFLLQSLQPAQRLAECRNGGVAVLLTLDECRHVILVTFRFINHLKGSLVCGSKICNHQFSTSVSLQIGVVGSTAVVQTLLPIISRNWILFESTLVLSSFQQLSSEYPIALG